MQTKTSEQKYHELVRLPKDAVKVDRAGTPQVYFDTSLGRQGRGIDFDTETYANYLRERGLTEDQVGHTAVRFADAPVAALLQLRSSYDSYDNIQRVNVGPSTSAEKMSKGVYHETEHHIANVTGTRAPKAWNYASNISLLASAAGTAAGSVLMAAGAAMEHGGTFEAGRNVAMGSLAVVALGQAIYASNPEERRAHKAMHDKTLLVHVKE